MGSWPITKTEEETCFVPPFHKHSVFHYTQAGNEYQVSIESGWNTNEYCWNDIYRRSDEQPSREVTALFAI